MAVSLCTAPYPFEMVDCVHGNMELSRVSKAVIDTLQFQRLRGIKQLGLTSEVYPGGVETRFTHSIGTAYLARKMALSLQRRHEKLEISSKDVLCVELAGLCHDLGHGPFSHTWEKILAVLSPGSKWTHEDMSCRLFHALYDNNKSVRDAFAKASLGARDRAFVQELISGKRYNPELGGPDVAGAGDASHGEWEFIGRGADKAYLYEIVSNKRNGIDVDKMDYMLRDSKAIGLTGKPITPDLFIDGCCVVEFKGIREIGYRESCEAAIRELFYRRAALHRKAYQHHTVQGIEQMLVDAFKHALPHFKFNVDNEAFDLVAASWNTKAFMKLTDDIIYKIADADCPELAPARELLNRLEERDLYRRFEPAFVEPRTMRKGREYYEEKLKGKILESLRDDVVLLSVSIKYGSDGTGNPVDRVAFVTKSGSIVSGGISPFRELVSPESLEILEYFAVSRRARKGSEEEEETAKEVGDALNALIKEEGLVNATPCLSATCRSDEVLVNQGRGTDCGISGLA